MLTEEEPVEALVLSLAMLEVLLRVVLPLVVLKEVLEIFVELKIVDSPGEAVQLVLENLAGRPD